MKDFVKMTLAVICGLFIMSVLSFFLFFGFVGALSAAGTSSKPVIPSSGVLFMDMSAIAVAEQASASNPLASMPSIAGLQGTGMAQVGLLSAMEAIDAAANDAGIKYIFLKTDGASASVSQLQELRGSLASFRNSGKPVIAYIEAPTTGSYYLASVADKVFMTANEGATTMLTGVGSQLIFLKDILDKFHVNVQLIRHGKYKSAGEMYVRNSSSPENLEQNQVMINSLWHEMAKEIAGSRGISEDQLNALIDNLQLNFNTDYLAAGLVDELLTRDSLCSRLADLAVETSFDKVSMIPFADYVAAKEQASLKVKGNIAIIYADGEIVDGSADRAVAGDRFARIIAKVRKDDAIKAVVLRVNSPGGSVLASDKIKTEIDLLRAQKPVVASYGDYAASGGYWISNSCDKIYTDATTLTGSIGVFSMIPEFSGTLKNIAHVNITSVNSNKHSDMYGLMRPFDAEETAYMQNSVERIYDTFVATVAEGRELSREYVDSIAQGRVWTGADALRIGLVDEIGTLQDAVRYAAAAADIAAPKTVGYPKPQTTMEMLMAALGNGANEDLNIFMGTPFEGVAKAAFDWSERWKKGERNVMFARLPYAMTID